MISLLRLAIFFTEIVLVQTPFLMCLITVTVKVYMAPHPFWRSSSWSLCKWNFLGNEAGRRRKKRKWKKKTLMLLLLIVLECRGLANWNMSLWSIFLQLYF